MEETRKTVQELRKITEEEREKRKEIEFQRDFLLKLLGNKMKESEHISKDLKFSGPVNYKTEEIVEELGKFILKIGCFDKYGEIISGSGILYGLSSDGKSIILTNYHITEDADLSLKYPCIVVYSSDPTKGFTDFYFAEPIYYPSMVSLDTMKIIDFDFLKLEAKFKFNEEKEIEIIYNTSLRISNYTPRICKNNEIKIGDEIVVLGYPFAGGNYLIVTEGIISGYDGDFYLITSAKIDRGSSGGGAFSKSRGCLVGMPTFVIKGDMESFARLINMAYLQENYLSKIFE